MSKITFETPCEIGDFYFVIFLHTPVAGADYYSIKPCRIDRWEYFSTGKLLISAKSINDGTSMWIEIGKNAFKNIDDAEKELLRLRGQENEKKRT